MTKPKKAHELTTQGALRRIFGDEGYRLLKAKAKEINEASSSRRKDEGRASRDPW